MTTCNRCIHYKMFQGEKCTRDMTLIDGRIIKQRNTGRIASQERDEKLAIWRNGNLERKPSDICGRQGKWFEQR
jgi:hypothetical protein